MEINNFGSHQINYKFKIVVQSQTESDHMKKGCNHLGSS